MDIGTQIKETRKKYGLSQKELARKMGVGQSYISGVEAGKESPSPMFLRLFQMLYGSSEPDQKDRKKGEDSRVPTYESVAKENIENGNLLEYSETKDMALISAGVLDFIAGRDPELRLRDALLILEDAKSILMQLRKI